MEIITEIFIGISIKLIPIEINNLPKDVSSSELKNFLERN